MLRYGLSPIIFLINNGGYTIEVEIHDGPYNVIKVSGSMGRQRRWGGVGCRGGEGRGGGPGGGGERVQPGKPG